MIPDIYDLLFNTPGMTALLGTGTPPDLFRVFPFDEAPQDTTKPYVTYTVYNGVPENHLNEVPKIDDLGTQVDVWAEKGRDCINLAKAVRDAIEPKNHMTSIGNMFKDPETKLYRIRMDFDFFTPR